MHGGAILSSASDGARVVTGGDDGKVVATDAKGNSETVATDAKRRWIDHVAVGPGGAVAWSAGKQAFAHTGKGAEKSLEVVSTVGGLAFAPKGVRLAIAHYNGATLWFPNAKAAPETLEWKGSHLGAKFSPDGRFLVTVDAGADAARLAARRPQGHAHVGLCVARALARLDRRRQVARDLGLEPARAVAVRGQGRPHGQAAAAARAGGAAGSKWSPAIRSRAWWRSALPTALVLLVRTDDGAEILAKKPGDAPVTALAWSATGKLLAFGTESGEAGIARSELRGGAMFVKLTADRRVVLEDRDNFRAFKLVVEGAPGAISTPCAARSRAPPSLPTPTPPGYRRRRCARRPEVAQDAAWQQSFAAMIEKARPHGWIDDARAAIKAHVEWVG